MAKTELAMKVESFPIGVRFRRLKSVFVGNKADTLTVTKHEEHRGKVWILADGKKRKDQIIAVIPGTATEIPNGFKAESGVYEFVRRGVPSKELSTSCRP
jgi:hypothetical protein